MPTLFADAARQAARDTDRRRFLGEPLGVLAGVLLTFKANLNLASAATTPSLTAFRELVAELFAPDERRAARERLDALVKGEAAGQAVRQAVEAVEAATTAIVASTASSAS
ncbi:MAG TPA: hypothetical protein VII06_20270 [Chloroflexota bacterium]